MPQAKYWCFTLNNYTQDEIPTSLFTGAVYLIFGKETSSTGTPHLQGFTAFNDRKRATQVQRMLKRACWSVARNLSASPEYCKKEGDFKEFGTLPAVCKSKPGKRNELQVFMEAVQGGLRDYKDLRASHPNVCARYPRFVEQYLRDTSTPPVIREPVLRDWQADLEGVLSGSPDDRSIFFIVDYQGNAGKSWYCRYLRQEKSALVLSAGKKADLAYVFSKTIPSPTIVCIDVPRSKMESLHYDFLEELKNGLLFSSKYESCYIEFEPPHVLVFCNEEPDGSKLSEDRYIIVKV